jgi:hypothetical protein
MKKIIEIFKENEVKNLNFIKGGDDKGVIDKSKVVVKK